MGGASGKLLLGGRESFHVLRTNREALGTGRRSPETGGTRGRWTDLLISLKFSEVLHLEQVSLHREQRHLRVAQDGMRDGVQLQTVLLQTEDLQTGTPRYLRGQTRDLENSFVRKFLSPEKPLGYSRRQTWFWFRLISMACRSDTSGGTL